MFYLVIKKKRCIIQTFSLTCCLSVLLLLLLALLLLLLPSCRSRHLSVVLFPPLLLLLRLLPFTSLPLSGLPLPLLRLPLLLQLWWRIRNKTNYIRFNVYDTWDLTNANLHTFFPQKAFLSCTVDLFLDVPHVLKNLKEKTLSSTNCCPFYSSLLSQWVFFLSHLVGTLFALLLIQTVPCCLSQAGLQRVILQIQPLQTLRAKTHTENEVRTKPHHARHDMFDSVDSAWISVSDNWYTEVQSTEIYQQRSALYVNEAAASSKLARRQ